MVALTTQIKDFHPQPLGCVIWMHGLGADASDMLSIAAQSSIAQLPLRHVFVDAPIRSVTLNAGMQMRAWYDILGMKLTDREDTTGILQSEAQILEIIKDQVNNGVEKQQIILAGFSQGGAMALYTALHTDLVSGVIALSSYLPIATQCLACLPKEVPFFLGYGKFDQIVLPAWVKQSEKHLADFGYNQITLREYPVEHTICAQEIEDIAGWLSAVLTQGVKAR